MLPGLVLCAIGAGMSGLALGQPAWLGGHVGPGLMAQILSLGVLGLGVAWAILLARGRITSTPSPGCGSDSGPPTRGLRHSAPALLGAVLTFALTLPFVGLVLAAGLAAALAAWGAGERTPRALALTVLGLMALVAIVGEALLPPTAPLWPAG
ncbi:MAG: tripartite tricarboxylate transporter TctB family protein [Tabrizicola sp.]|nr:tripartite tricarboxylate transporter TctB family protein [Tabrizicola sp.]